MVNNSNNNILIIILFSLVHLPHKLLFSTYMHQNSTPNHSQQFFSEKEKSQERKRFTA